MVLAAGLGTRLRPITSVLPKPLVTFLNKPLIDWVLDDLARAGVSRCVVNSHHLHEKLVDHISRRPLTPLVTISHEPVILGTGGGIAKVMEFFGDEPFIVQNSDCILYPEYASLSAVLSENAAPAALLIMDREDKDAYGIVEVDEEGRVLDIAGLVGRGSGAHRSGMFVGVHAMSPGIYDFMPRDRDAFDIVRDVYVPILREGGEIRAVFHRGPFYDIGSLQSYQRANLSALGLVEEMFPELVAELDRRGPGIYIDRSALIHHTAMLRGPLMIGAGCEIMEGAEIGPDVIMGEHSIAAAASRVQRAVVLPYSAIPSGSRIYGKLIAPR